MSEQTELQPGEERGWTFLPRNLAWGGLAEAGAIVNLGFCSSPLDALQFQRGPVAAYGSLMMNRGGAFGPGRSDSMSLVSVRFDWLADASTALEDFAVTEAEELMAEAKLAGYEIDHRLTELVRVKRAWMAGTAPYCSLELTRDAAKRYAVDVQNTGELPYGTPQHRIAECVVWSCRYEYAMAAYMAAGERRLYESAQYFKTHLAGEPNTLRDARLKRDQTKAAQQERLAVRLMTLSPRRR